MIILLNQSLSYFTLFIERYSSIVEGFILKEEEGIDSTGSFLISSQISSNKLTHTRLNHNKGAPCVSLGVQNWGIQILQKTDFVIYNDPGLWNLKGFCHLYGTPF